MELSPEVRPEVPSEVPQTEINPNQRRLDFIRRRRGHHAPETLLQTHIQERAEEVKNVIEEPFNELKERFSQTRNEVKDLRETVEKHQFLETPKAQTGNLTKTADALKKTLSKLESTLDSKQRELEKLNQKKKELQTSLSNFSNTLKNTPIESPYSRYIIDASKEMNNLITQEK